MFSHFSTILAYDRQTDGQTDMLAKQTNIVQKNWLILHFYCEQKPSHLQYIVLEAGI